jgi:hypothetical protein
MEIYFYRYIFVEKFRFEISPTPTSVRLQDLSGSQLVTRFRFILNKEKNLEL